MESRTFDSALLTKSSLMKDWHSEQTTQRPDYRQFKSKYPKESLILLLFHKQISSLCFHHDHDRSDNFITSFQSSNHFQTFH